MLSNNDRFHQTVLTSLFMLQYKQMIPDKTVFNNNPWSLLKDISILLTSVEAVNNNLLVLFDILCSNIRIQIYIFLMLMEILNEIIINLHII